MNAYEAASTSSLWGRSNAAMASRYSPPLWSSVPHLADEDEQARQTTVLCTLEEVATELGISREQVRVIEQRALRKCLAFCKARGLRLEDLLAN